MYKEKEFEYSLDMNEIRNRLLNLRLDNKLTVKDLCDVLSLYLEDGISDDCLRRYENGNRRFPLSVMAAYSKHFRCSMDYIFFGKETNYSNDKLKQTLEDLNKIIQKTLDNLSE